MVDSVRNFLSQSDLNQPVPTHASVSTMQRLLVSGGVLLFPALAQVCSAPFTLEAGQASKVACNKTHVVTNDPMPNHKPYLYPHKLVRTTPYRPAGA